MFASSQRWSFTKIWITRLITILSTSILIFIWVQKFNKLNHSSRNLLTITSVLLVIYAIFYTSIRFLNIPNNYTDNILLLNLKSVIHSPEWNADTKNNYSDYIIETRGAGKNPNIILVFAESLSAINSANSSWYDNMPKFDEIQKQWIRFTNFITNWTTSDTAHIATLLWVHPLINIWRYSSPYSGYKLLMQTLPEYLNSQWYYTTFVSAVSLDFLNQRDFLSWAWFQKIIWEEEFEDYKKYTFDAASDGDLYDRVLQEIQAETWKYFIWLQTISFHKPYITPYGKTESLALQYSDDELYEFYQNLQKIWFFNNWILIILWDHRMMNPAVEWEYDLLWDNWYTKSVATVVWEWIQSWVVNSNIIQHTDFYNSIKKLVGHGNVQVDKTYNNVFNSRSNRNRWITNAEVYENNRYAVSFLGWKTRLFKWLSNLKDIDSEIYNYFSSYMNYEFGENHDEENDSQIKIIWHRWAIDVSPENTLESFLAAKQQWANWIEFDVSYTKDHQNVVAHWPEMYASNCTKEKVWDYDLDWITENCTIKNWEKYLTLAEMLWLIDWLFDYYFVELKVYDETLWAQQTLEAIQTVKDLSMQDRVIFISYSDAARRTLNSDSDIIFWRDTFNISDLDFVGDNNSKYFLVPYNLLTPEIIQRVYWLWKIPVTYTVNTTWDYQKVKDLWINIIMTDKISDIRMYDNSIL